MRPAFRSTLDQRGFTLIELLVVILIIGILAAIAIPSFLGQRERANDAEAKTAVRTAMTAADTYFTGNDQSYSGISRDALVEIEPTLRQAPWSSNWCDGRTGVYGTGDVVCVAMRSRAASGGQFEIRRDPSYGIGMTRVCSNVGKSGCKDSNGSYGKW